VKHYLHLSSAAVQGNVSVLDATSNTHPFSPYSKSKALGESVVSGVSQQLAITIVRATSVQGPDRKTTKNLQKLARSPLASVAKPGTQPTSVSSIYGLVNFVIDTALDPSCQVSIVLQPWEGGTVSSVLELASGGKRPMYLPAMLCRFIIWAGRAVSRFLGGRYPGHIRRLELMWFGQSQEVTPEQTSHGGGVAESLIRALTTTSNIASSRRDA
jgi:hypothetical protein